MAETLPPGTPEVDDPLLVADLIRLLSIKGAIGRLPLADIVIPTVSLGDVVTPSIDVLQPAFRSTDVFSAGELVSAPANTVHADTGPLAAGTYDVQLQIPQTVNSNMLWRVQHRNAANTANLATWQTILHATTGGIYTQTLGYELGGGERLRIVNNGAFVAGEASTAIIFARARS